MNLIPVQTVGFAASCIAAITLGSPAITQAAPEVLDRGPHHVTIRDGNSKYEQVENGLHRWDAQQQTWVVTDPKIELFQDGAIVRNLQYSVIFSPSLADPGAIDIQLPTGERMVGQIMGLSYTLGPNSVLVDEIRPCAGEIVGDKELIFRSAFTDYDIDVVFRVERGVLSQSIIIKTQLPHPRDFGFAEAEAEDAHVELLTEWTTLPAVQKQTRVIAPAARRQHPLTHERIQVGGSMEFLGGRAFSLGGNRSIAVASSLEVIENRTFLLEKIPWRSLAPELQGLPVQARVGPRANNARLAKAPRPLPAKRIAKTKVKPIQMAALGRASVVGGASVLASRGFLWDWELASTISKKAWLPNVTYYIAGNCVVQTNEFFGGTILKYAPTNSAKLTITGPVTVNAGMYRPITLTARDDHSLGDGIGSSALSGYYADTALYLDAFTSGLSYNLEYFRIRHANFAVTFYTGSGHMMSHGSIVKCGEGIKPYYADTTLRNVIIQDCGLTVGASGTSTIRAENVTWYKTTNFNPNGATLYMTNCLVVEYGPSYPPSYTGANNINDTSGANHFQELGASKVYLKPGSSARNAGTTNVNPDLLAALRERTTSPPLILSNKVLLDTVLTRAVQRDTDAVDIGAHLDPIDYCINNLAVSNATLVITNGVVLATFGDNGIYVEQNGKLISAGHPLRPNFITRAYAVQEQATNWLNAGVGTDRSLFAYWTGEPPVIDLRWTTLAAPAGGGYQIYADTGNFVITNFSMRDCQIYGGQLYLWDEGAFHRYYFTNNLFHYVDLQVFDAKVAQFYNNTFVGASGFLWQTISNQNWKFDDNLLDSSPLINASPWMTHSNNALYNSADFYSIYSTNSSELGLSSLSYAKGRLGNYYLPTNSLLLDAGTLTNAALRGMYHFTVLTNEMKELTNRLDIGFHSPALTTNWSSVLLQDQDGDSFGDLFEDRNGNGIWDSAEGETDWTSYNSVLGIGSGPGLVVFTPLK